MKPPPPFNINYTEGAKVGYRWFEAEGKRPLFPFGFGLSYTTFSYSDLKVATDGGLKVSFTVANAGSRTGAEVAQVYVLLPPSSGEPFKRLAAWKKSPLTPGERKIITLDIDPEYLSIFNVSKNSWELLPGKYVFYVGGSSQKTPLSQALMIKDNDK